MPYRYLVLSLFFLFFSVLSSESQVNLPVQKVTLQQGNDLTNVELFSLSAISTIQPFSHDTQGGGFTAVAGRPGFFRLRYNAPTDYVGLDVAVFECTENITGKKSYVTVEVRIVKSILIAENDFATINPSETSVEFNLTANDQSSTGDFAIVDIELVKNGKVDLLSDESVRFSTDENFEEVTFFNYIIRDDKGTTTAGVAYIDVRRNTPPVVDTLKLKHSSSQPLLINMSGGTFNISSDYVLSFGELKQLSPFSFIYETAIYDNGYEFFLLESTDTGLKRYVEIELIKDIEIEDIIVDDIAFTTPGQFVFIDALANDYKSDIVVVDYSPELIYTSGIFSYDAPVDFLGVKQFTYTVHDGKRAYTGNINVYVGNYLPRITEYLFTTRKNTPLVLEYKIPIENYSFSVKKSPNNGSLEVNQSQIDFNSCSIIEGYQMISYVPNSNYLGDDLFELEYCVLNGPCRTVKISLMVNDV